MKSELLALGTGVFYLRGTTNECVPATIVGSLSKADCVAIQYERSGHSWSFLISPCVLLHMVLHIPNPSLPTFQKGAHCTKALRPLTHAVHTVRAVQCAVCFSTLMYNICTSAILKTETTPKDPNDQWMKY